MIIGQDVDGVHYGFNEALRKLVCKSTGRASSDFGPALTWEFYKNEWGLTSDEFLHYYAEGIRCGDIFLTEKAVPGGKEMVDRLLRDGHEVHFITARYVDGIDPQLCYDQTEEWLKREGYNYTSLTVTRHKTEKWTDIFLDDSPKYYHELDEAGTLSILWDQPWNRYYGGRRVYSWDEFLEEVDWTQKELGVAKK